MICEALCLWEMLTWQLLGDTAGHRELLSWDGNGKAVQGLIFQNCSLVLIISESQLMAFFFFSFRLVPFVIRLLFTDELLSDYYSSSPSQEV